MKGKKIALVMGIALVVLGMLIDLLLSLNELLYWRDITIGIFFLWVIDVCGTLVCLAVVWYFFRLIKLVFRENYVKEFPEIIWSFFVIIPRIAKNNFGTLMTLWRRKVSEKRED